MSRQTARRLRRHEDEGFSLVEVLVAITLFGLLSSAVVPLLITAARASSITKYDTGARNLGQERLERMRTAPFHTPASANAGPDLLDTYFKDLGAAGTKDAPGFVETSARTPQEPTGPFYRYIVPDEELAPDAATAETFSRYDQRVATQFLNASGVPFKPTSWVAATANDTVPSFIVRVTVVTTWTVGPLSKSYALSSNITAGRAEAPVVRAEARATALRISSRMPEATTVQGADLLFEGGAVTADGQITRGARVSSSSLGGFASLIPGLRVDGASKGASSPANATSPAANESPKTLNGDLGELVHFGSTSVGTSTTSADNGQIAAGTAAAPVTASMATNSDIRFGNQPVDSTGRLGLLGGTAPVVFNLTTTGLASAESTAQLASSGGSSHKVSGTVTSRTPLLAVMPTTYAPQGLLQVRLESSSLSCAAGIGVTPTSLTYLATVRYWMRTSTGAEGYSTTQLTLTQASADDVLASLLGSGATSAVPVHQNPDGTVLTYADYFSDLASATASSLAAGRTATPGGIESRHPGLLRLSTVSLREDIDAPVTVQLGVLSCLAQDVR